MRRYKYIRLTPFQAGMHATKDSHREMGWGHAKPGVAYYFRATTYQKEIICDLEVRSGFHVIHLGLDPKVTKRLLTRMLKELDKAQAQQVYARKVKWFR